MQWLTDPIPNLLHLSSLFSIRNVYVDSGMQRCIRIGVVLVVNVDLQVENLGKNLCRLRRGSVVQSITTYTIAIVGIKGTGRDDLLQQLEIVCSCSVEEPLVCCCPVEMR